MMSKLRASDLHKRLWPGRWLKFVVGCGLGVMCAFLVAGCGEDGAEGPTTTRVEIRFDARVNGAEFECGVSYGGLGVNDEALAFSDMRFFVHDLVLLGPNGEEAPVTLIEDGVWQRDGVALLDFEDGCENGTTQVNHSVLGEAPEGEWTGLRFSVGVPPSLNSSETVLEGRGSPLNLSAMFWSWRSGYKYVRLDTDSPFFRFHLGAVGCDDEFQCDEVNIPTFTIDGLDINTDAVALDIGELLADSDLSQNTEGTAPGCMGESSDADCTPIFARFGLGQATPSAFSALKR